MTKDLLIQVLLTIIAAQTAGLFFFSCFTWYAWKALAGMPPSRAEKVTGRLFQGGEDPRL
jgi:hypothetical protein